MQADSTASPAAIRDTLVGNASAGYVIDPGIKSPNRLLYVPDPTPVALHAVVNGRFVSAGNGGKKPLIANAAAIGPEENST